MDAAPGPVSRASRSSTNVLSLSMPQLSTLSPTVPSPLTTSTTHIVQTCHGRIYSNLQKEINQSAKMRGQNRRKRNTANWLYPAPMRWCHGEKLKPDGGWLNDISRRGTECFTSPMRSGAILFLPRGSVRFPECWSTSPHNRTNNWEEGVAEPQLVVQVKRYRHGRGVDVANITGLLHGQYSVRYCEKSPIEITKCGTQEVSAGEGRGVRQRSNPYTPVCVDAELEHILRRNGPSQGAEVPQKCGQDGVNPPQTDSGIKSRDVFLRISKDLLGRLLPDGVDLFPVVTISYRQRRDAQQVGL